MTTATLLPHHLAPTPPDAPFQPGDRVNVLHACNGGTCVSLTTVRECLRGPSGRFMVTVDAPTGLPAEHEDARPGLYSTVPGYVTHATGDQG